MTNTAVREKLYRSSVKKEFHRLSRQSSRRVGYPMRPIGPTNGLRWSKNIASVDHGCLQGPRLKFRMPEMSSRLTLAERR